MPCAIQVSTYCGSRLQTRADIVDRPLHCGVKFDPSLTRFHHHLRRRTVDILLEPYSALLDRANVGERLRWGSSGVPAQDMAAADGG
jgi:hypothetical protein